MAENFKLNERLQLAFDYLSYTGRNVFLTGKAGTGKTTFLKKLKQTSPKRMIITSPTGVAAVNAGGVTLHSFFQLPLGPQIPGVTRTESKKFNFNKVKIDIIRSLELLVIDEISMVRADLLDSVDAVLKRYRSNNKPFGGLQLLLIGDMQQLSPVVKPEDEAILKPYYDTFYFFGSKAWQQTEYVCIELNEVFRQTDQTFVNILNAIRENRADKAVIDQLNRQYKPNFTPSANEDIVTLVTTNSHAERINQTHMLELNTAQQSFDADINGDFPESAYPVEKRLTLKKNAVVMFLKNDPSPAKEFFNGKIGRITGFEDDCVLVKCKENAEDIRVGKLTWDNTKYTVNNETKEISEEVVGTFKQIPLKTAWAVTIHKSQGLTFDKLMIDASRSFAHGQVYVALSRCRTLEGLILLNPLSERDLIYDNTVQSFSKVVEERTPDNANLVTDKRQYYFDCIEELFDFNPIYNALQTLQRNTATFESSIFGNYKQINGLESIIFGDMIVVSEKFIKYVRYTYKDSSDMDSETALLERICKGCGYYLDKMNNLLETKIMTFDFQCDDKTKKQKISDSYNDLVFQFKYRKAILKIMQDSFSLKKYLEQKAKLSITLSESVNNSFTTTNTTRWRSDESLVPDSGSELYKLLLKWRKEKAEEYDVEPKEIITTRTLASIAEQEPDNLNELLAIKGINGKAKKFVSDILEIIFKYLASNGKRVNTEDLKRADFEKLSTQEKTFQLYKQGIKISEIVKQRKLKEETILGHLAKYVATGEINPTSIMEEAKFNTLKEYVKKHENLADSTIKDKLSNNFSYGEIKIVRSAIEAEQKEL
ncbi:MAG: helix-turn-helix domain-containing protein [Bacteroidales bacterium]|nr:helix-turn-helix domain-containing protein [Bacteroidales bacterium]